MHLSWVCQWVLYDTCLGLPGLLMCLVFGCLDGMQSHSPVQEREIGFVFQNYALSKHISLLESICLLAEARTCTLAQERPPSSSTTAAGKENTLPRVMSNEEFSNPELLARNDVFCGRS